MNCNEISDKLPLFIDNELSNEEMLQINEHIQSCENCKNELEEYKKIIEVLKSLPEEEPPEGYCKRLHDKLTEASAAIQNEKSSKIKPLRKVRWLKYGGIAASLMLLLLVYGFMNMGNMGMKNKSVNDMYSQAETPKMQVQSPETGAPPMAPEEEAKYESQSYNGDRGNVTTDTVAGVELMSLEDKKEMKIVKTGTISTQTENYDNFLNDLTTEINSIGGFLESNNTEVYQIYENKKLMYGNLKIRVPQENFYGIIDYLENNTEVRRKNINETDLTKEYYEKDNRVKNLEVQEQNLRKLFDKANTVEEMLQIENELRRIRTEIDSINISLSDIDDRASMSTINLEVEEVLAASLSLKTGKGVWERSRDGFINTVNEIIRALENFVVRIVSSSPVLIPLIIIFIVGFLKIKKYTKRKTP